MKKWNYNGSRLTAHGSRLLRDLKKFQDNDALTSIITIFLIAFFTLLILLMSPEASGAASVMQTQSGTLTPADRYAPSQSYQPSNNYTGENFQGQNITGQPQLTGQPNFDYDNTQPQFENNNYEQNFNNDTNNLTPESNDNNLDETTLTDAEINDYFNEILEAGTVGGNTIGTLFRRLPRYGMSFFRRSPSTYAPMETVPVAQDYRINVGDEMTLSMWGIPEEGNYRFTVRRDGTTILPKIGTVKLVGYTFAEAERFLNQQLSKYYTGYQMHLSMGRLSSIMVYVTGNARRPGAYTISSFSTLVNALLASGGPSSNGTLRRIELKRGGQTIALFDMYAMLMKGDKTQDVRLQAGDVIYIPPVGDLIGIAGETQQPGVYELNGRTRVQDLLYIAGGLNARTFTGRIQYFKIIDHTYASAIEGTISDFYNSELHDGDILRLYPVFNFTSTILISGALFNPGTYAIVPGETKLSEIIQRGAGLTATASNKAIITRITPTLKGPEHKRFNIDLEKALSGDPENDIALEPNDRITIMVIPEWKGQITISITGEVKCPGTYYMFPGEKISDLIERAEGFTAKAYLRGAIFTRKSVAAQQRMALSNMADQLEMDLLQTIQDSTDPKADALYQRHRQLINKLRTVDIMGRLITKIDTPKNIIGTEWNYELKDGDALHIPEQPLTVNVMGAVYNSSSQTYHSNMSINAYINASGGAIKTAHKRMLYLIKSDGTTIKLTRNTAALSSRQWKAPTGFSSKIEPGDTIVVPVKVPDRQSLENLRDTIDIIYKVAITAGVILRD